MSRTLALSLTIFVVSCQGAPPLSSEPEAEVGPFTDLRVRGGSIAERAPPPIIGGTLGFSEHASTIVAADTDRDRVMLVRRDTLQVIEVPLPDGAQPGRVATNDTQAFVVLRGTGEVATIALTGPATVTHREVCAAPRGVAWDEARGLVWVVCQGGELVSFAPASLTAGNTVVQVDADDLRDVLVSGDALIVTRFRSAELLRLDLRGHIQTRVQPPPTPNFARAGDSGGDFVPAVAWRAVISGMSVVVTHQRAVSGTIDVSPMSGTPRGEDLPAETGGAYGSSPPGVPAIACGNAVVQSAVTSFDAVSLLPQTTQLVTGGALPVDIAVSPSGLTAAVPIAGIQRTENAASVSFVRVGISSSGDCGSRGDDTAMATAMALPSPIAVLYLPDGRLVAQSREPSVLTIGSNTIALGGAPMFDVGHALFHTDAGHGVACASCHPEGGDDGRTWTFSDSGDRRTIALPAGLLSTAPFHWNGELASMGDLMHLVFTDRMGGGAIDSAHVGDVATWLDTRPMQRTVAIDSEAARRGRALFEGPAECSTCHNGTMLTNATTVDVGTGGAFQVPSLIGVAHRLPVMHNGCAASLRDRFTPTCGGRQHGNQSLDEAQITDLIAYLHTL